jgi:hypothetical protein
LAGIAAWRANRSLKNWAATALSVTIGLGGIDSKNTRP